MVTSLFSYHEDLDSLTKLPNPNLRHPLENAPSFEGQALHPFRFTPLSLITPLALRFRRNAINSLKTRIKRKENHNFEDIRYYPRYVRLDKTIIPIQQLNHHLIRACQELMSIGNEMTKAYCLILMGRLGKETITFGKELLQNA